MKPKQLTILGSVLEIDEGRNLIHAPDNIPSISDYIFRLYRGLLGGRRGIYYIGKLGPLYVSLLTNHMGEKYYLQLEDGEEKIIAGTGCPASITIQGAKQIWEASNKTTLAQWTWHDGIQLCQKSIVIDWNARIQLPSLAIEKPALTRTNIEDHFKPVLPGRRIPQYVEPDNWDDIDFDYESSIKDDLEEKELQQINNPAPPAKIPVDIEIYSPASPIIKVIEEEENVAFPLEESQQEKIEETEKEISFEEPKPAELSILNNSSLTASLEEDNLDFSEEAEYEIAENDDNDDSTYPGSGEIEPCY